MIQITPQDMRDLFDVFGNFLGTAITIAASAGFLWRGIKARFDAQDAMVASAIDQNDKDHVVFKESIKDHETRLRRYEWHRPIREEEGG
jgi:hypothetical protein